MLAKQSVKVLQIESSRGLYFYADYVNKRIKSFRYDLSTNTIGGETNLTSLWTSLYGAEDHRNAVAAF